jgi:hypothetical protein
MKASSLVIARLGAMFPSFRFCPNILGKQICGPDQPYARPAHARHDDARELVAMPSLVKAE